MPQQPSSTILKEILRAAERSRAGGQKTLAVFDLDSTLFDLKYRVGEIVDSFAEVPENRERYPELCRRLESVEILSTDWGIGEALARCGLHEKDHRDFFADLRAHWSAGFFSDNYLHHDEPIHGSVEYVNELYKAGAEIMYLTGRDIPRMLKGTELSLIQHGFPIHRPGVFVELKPTADMDDARFKADLLKQTESRYEKIWLFENEPVNVNLVARECPKIELIFIESTHSGLEQISDSVVRIRDFKLAP